MSKKITSKKVSQKYLNLQTTNFKQAEAERLVKTSTSAGAKRLIINTYEYELKLIKRNRNYTKREIQGFENKLKKLKELPNSKFKNVSFIKNQVNYLIGKNKKDPTITNNNLRAKLLTNDKIFTKAGKLRKRFNNVALSLNGGFSIQQSITIFLRHLKGWIRRHLISLSKVNIKSGGNIVPIYIINIMGYSADNFLDMLETQFGIDIDLFMFNVANMQNSAMLFLKPHMTALIDRYEKSNWLEKIR